jgi:aspartyl-tRNA(Asn)/glutamyl-tRNA(Gln) amidotransferase subunit A
MTTEELIAAVDEPDRRAEISALDLTESLLDRIDRYQPVLNAFITITPELARADAARVDEARRQGRPTVLDGMPIAVKDNVDVGGVPTTVGSPRFRDAVAAEDAEAVARLRSAGGIIVGKTLLHELVFGVSCDNPWYGTGRNPWDPERIPGGSSGGSAAALAADLCIGALGSDTGGSVRIPAALNGVTGLRPTFGAISARGAFPIAWSLDTVGPMARSVRDVERMFATLVGYDSRDPRAVPRPAASTSELPTAQAGSLTIGVPSDYFFDDLDPEVERCVRGVAETFEQLGADVRDVVLPRELKTASEIYGPLLCTEALALHRAAYEEQPERFGEDVRRRLALGGTTSGADFAEMQQRAIEWRCAVDSVFSTTHIILTPTTSRVAPPIDGTDSVDASRELGAFTGVWSLAHVPAISLPCGLTESGLPVGVQLVAARWSEDLLFATAAGYQGATDWHRRRPPGFESGLDDGRSASLPTGRAAEASGSPTAAAARARLEGRPARDAW